MSARDLYDGDVHVHGDAQTDITMPYDERNNETGQFTPTYSADEFLAALRTLGGNATTQDVREEVGCAYRTALYHLTELEADGDVQSRDVGPTKLWDVAEPTEASEASE